MILQNLALVELITDYNVPLYQVQRAIHIHAQVHTNWSVISNGTIAHGPIVSTGQIFIDEALEEEIMAVEPYASHTQIERVPNDDDGIYTTESMSKSFPFSFAYRSSGLLCRCLWYEWLRRIITNSDIH
jgi:hypothetical protein